MEVPDKRVLYRRTLLLYPRSAPHLDIPSLKELSQGLAGSDPVHCCHLSVCSFLRLWLLVDSG